MLSSKLEVCSVKEVGLAGATCLGSLSTCSNPPILALLQREREKGDKANHDVEIDELFRKGGELVREAERILADEVGGKDVVALALLFAFEDDGVGRVGDGVVYIERAA